MKNFIAFLLLLISIGLSAQLNPKDIYINAKVGEPVYVVLNTASGPNVVVEPTAFDALSFDPIPGTGQTEFLFTPVDGFIGDESITIEYFVPGGFPGMVIPNYTTLHYRIKSSKIDLIEDYALASVGSAVEIDVLSNDNSSDGGLTIDRLGLIEGGIASIVNNKIEFSIDTNADLAYIRYFVSDSTGNIEGSKLFVQRESDDLIETRDLFVDNLSSINLHLNSLDFTANTIPQNGSLEYNGHVAVYSPNSSFEGIESLIFSAPNGGEITYNINVISKAANNSFVQDDQIFVTTNGSIDFNVFSNDYRDDFNIVDYSPELSYNGNGSFSFQPTADFTGDLTYFYKIFAGFQFHTGNITIHVDDFAPSQEYDYDFTILKNHDLKINHDTPTSDYTFSLAVAPTFGSVIVLGANQSEVLECDVISGENTIIYIPDADFNGVDEFDIEYCTISGDCEIVKVDVNILDSNFTDCLCLNSCVFEGDYNDDGVVNAKDALDLGLNIGEGGFDRTNDFTLFWTGQESSDWGHGQMSSNIDLKCGDGDGDGYIDFGDFDELEEHYGNIHNFVPNNVGQLSSLPISFVPQSTDVDSGEWMFIDIYVGNAANPALDFYGTSFTFNINPDVIDSSSVIFNIADNNWMSYESPLYEFYEVPQDGQIDIAVSRISNASTDGIGLIGTLEFIIEEEVQGLKKRFSINSFTQELIAMTDIISVNEKGQFKKHPKQSKVITINSGNDDIKEDLSSKVDVYPNPTSSIFTIDADNLNIDRVEIYDALGQKISSSTISQSYKYEVDLTSVIQGVYFVKVFSQGEIITKKIQKID